jgi:hypothetical protein
MRSNTSDPIEGKVWAGTVGSGAGATVSAFTLWLLGVTIWHAPSTSEAAGIAVTSVPLPVAGIVALLITVGGTFVAGYMAKHTVRPAPAVEDVQVDDDYESQERLARRDPTDEPAHDGSRF